MSRYSSLLIVEIISIFGWVTLCSLSSRNLLESYADPCEKWKDKFVRIRGREDASLATTKATGDFRFPLLWITYLHLMKVVDFGAFFPLEQEVV